MDEFDESLDSIEVPKATASLSGLTIVCLISALTHLYTGNSSNALGSIIIAMCTGFFVFNPTFFSITLSMSSSLMYFIVSSMLFITTFTNVKIYNIQDKVVLDLWTILLDAITSGGIFSITNHIWNSPSHKSNLFVPHWAVLDGKDVSYNVWTPFNGIGRPIGHQYI